MNNYVHFYLFITITMSNMGHFYDKLMVVFVILQFESPYHLPSFYLKKWPKCSSEILLLCPKEKNLKTLKLRK